MSLLFALKAAVNGTTGPRAILMYGLRRTKHVGVSPGNDQRREFSRRTGGRASAAKPTYVPEPVAA